MRPRVLCRHFGIGPPRPLAGGVLGALFLRGAQWFLPTEWQALAAPVGVLLVLLVLPSGLGGLWFRVRDAALRWVAERRGLLVPSLVADAAPSEPRPEPTPEPDEAAA